ncbi:hypothetical protein LJC26_08500 [Desulfovibrio sp. OttesenSCG-928-O18]|nr:hypothetical protein [Desulfovibrio sp. OttesenSCG-928-O18]
MTGCAQNNIVHLSYPPAGGNAIQASRQSRVCVVDFENLRNRYDIGSRLDGTLILPRTAVERWLALGLAAELTRSGYTVVTAETLPEALATGADYIVTGESLEVRLAENSITRFTATVRTNITLMQGGGAPLTTNGYNSVFSRTIISINRSVPQTLLDEALAEMLHPATELLTKIMP